MFFDAKFFSWFILKFLTNSFGSQSEIDFVHKVHRLDQTLTIFSMVCPIFEKICKILFNFVIHVHCAVQNASSVGLLSGFFFIWTLPIEILVDFLTIPLKLLILAIYLTFPVFWTLHKIVPMLLIILHYFKLLLLNVQLYLIGFFAFICLILKLWNALDFAIEISEIWINSFNGENNSEKGKNIFYKYISEKLWKFY